MKRLLIVAHAPSPNTGRLAEAVLRGARHPDVTDVEAEWIAPLEASADDVLAADAVVLGTPENLGYMSGALKDFFDRIYYECIDHTEALPYALYVRAGRDGTGTQRAVASITTGLRWKAVCDPLICRGAFDDAFETQCEELGLTLAAGLEAGIF
ncbi:flavodoxin family protein [Salinisphaera orenii]|uniref:Flavodoxin n=1 Tax=Salinisphaera orenii YIM 95161 TaxID=1051139 RepID=A0A423Q3X3_9GAMM|nr:NAD(P)H-dependent oxidoreductase [Salinisphaera halophila]ROO33772.1 flavodoxin [Salinisphaera halophila YIM 95161]